MYNSDWCLYSSFYRPQTKLQEGYIFTAVCDSFHRGVCLSACWDTTPQTRHPPRAGTVPWSRHPAVQCMLGDTVNKRVVCILLECNLVYDIILHKHSLIYSKLFKWRIKAGMFSVSGGDFGFHRYLEPYSGPVFMLIYVVAFIFVMAVAFSLSCAPLSYISRLSLIYPNVVTLLCLGSVHLSNLSLTLGQALQF